MCTMTVELLDSQCQWLLKCLGGTQMMQDFVLKRRLQKRKGCWQKEKKRKKNGNKNGYKDGLTFAPMLHLPFPPPKGISFLRRLGYPFLYRVYFLSLRHSYRGCCDSAKIYRRSYKRNIYWTKQAQEIKETSPPRHFTTGSNPFLKSQTLDFPVSLLTISQCYQTDQKLGLS